MGVGEGIDSCWRYARNNYVASLTHSRTLPVLIGSLPAFSLGTGGYFRPFYTPLLLYLYRELL